MLIQEVTPQMIIAWKDTWNEYKDRLHPNRKSGVEIVEYLKNKYPLREIHDTLSAQTVIQNVLNNKPFYDKLPAGLAPSAVTFIVKKTGAGKALYEKQDEIFMGNKIFVGVDIHSGYFCVEGSSMLWDELYAFRGLDKQDIQNFYCVAEYISCLQKFDLLEKICQ